MSRYMEKELRELEARKVARKKWRREKKVKDNRENSKLSRKIIHMIGCPCCGGLIEYLPKDIVRMTCDLTPHNYMYCKLDVMRELKNACSKGVLNRLRDNYEMRIRDYCWGSDTATRYVRTYEQECEKIINY